MPNGSVVGDVASCAADGLTLGISIVQGSDNNVYVKDLVKNGPGERHGIQIGDQVGAISMHICLHSKKHGGLTLNVVVDVTSFKSIFCRFPNLIGKRINYLH